MSFLELVMQVTGRNDLVIVPNCVFECDEPDPIEDEILDDGDKLFAEEYPIE